MSTLPPAHQDNNIVKATLGAAHILGCPPELLGRLFGCDPGRVARHIETDTAAKETARLFLNCYRSLHDLLNGAEDNMRYWFSAENYHFGCAPKERMQQTEGLTAVSEYLATLVKKPKA